MDLTKYAQPVATDNELKSVTGVAKRLLAKTEELASMELAVSELKAEVRELNEKTFPDLMDELSLVELPMTDGTTLVVKDVVAASITKANQEAAFGWLRDNNEADLIKHVMSMSFTRGEDDKAEAVRKLIPKDVGIVDKESVPPQTLSAWARRHLAAGKEFPDSITVFCGRKTAIKQEK